MKNDWHFLGMDKSTIKQLMHQKHLEYIEFCHWLYLPSLQLLLSFHQQRCHSKTHL